MIIESWKYKELVTVVELVFCLKTGNQPGLMRSCSQLERKLPASPYGHIF